LEELGICFCFAPQLHPAMKHVSAVRKQLGVATIFNLLGPLCNPASAPYQLLGVGKPELHERLASVLARLEPRRAVVVHGEDGLGEVTLGGPTRVMEVCGSEMRAFVWRPEDFGLAPAARDTLVVAGPAESAALIRRVLNGERGPPRDIVLLNAAAALWTVGKAETPREGAELAAHAIDSGAAARLLEQLAALSSRP
jgi:anthranilate phosphoribosyltransferase